MTDSLERFLQDLRFDVPTGVVERAKAAVAADAAGARQVGRGRVHNRGDSDTQRQTWAPALVAVLLAIAIVATLLFVGHALHSTAPTPAKHGPPITLHHNGYLVVGNGDNLIAIDPGTGAQHKVLSETLPVSDAAYTPDGTRLAYLKGGGSIWVLDIATGRTMQLTTCECAKWSHLSWSPDGLHLAFSDSDQLGSPQLYVIDADGTHRTQLTHMSGGQGASQPSWSPDGTRIAFTVLIGGLGPTNWDIDVIRTDGSGLAVLTAGVKDPWDPAWSPDGSRIAYVLDPPYPQGPGTPFEYQLWLMDPDGSHRTNVFVSPGCCVRSWGGPAWSPDGTRIAVVAGPPPPPVGTRSLSGYNLWVMNADGSGAQIVPGVVIGDRPAWQPLP